MNANSEFDTVEVLELGDVWEETKGVFTPSSFECSTQAVDARDA
jgi:hypothetical protein